MSYQGKRVLITGGSSGIGLALGRQLAAAGAEISILARDPEKLAWAASELDGARSNGSPEISTMSIDVRDQEQVAAGLTSWLDRGGPPDYLFNSAGVAHPGYAHELDLEIFHWMMDVNYFGSVHVTQELLPAMLSRGQGHVVNLSSVAGFLGVYGYTAYGASKFAVRGYSDALRAELKSRGVKVSIVFPPDTQTPQLDYENQFKPAETKALAGSDNPLSADEVARVILNGVARGRYVIIPGLGNWMYYWLSGALGPILYPVMDIFVNQARNRSAQD